MKHKHTGGKNQVKQQSCMITLRNTVIPAGTVVLGSERRNSIADGDPDHGNQIFDPGCCGKSGKGIGTENIDHRLHQHHADRNR